MAIIATDSGGGDFKKVPPGTHLAVCNMVVDLGKQKVQSAMYGESIKHQIFIRWELPDERLEWTDREGREHVGPMTVSKQYTLSLHENAALRGDLEAWRGKPFTEEERKGFDVSKLLGVPCLVTVTHKDGGNGKVYTNVTAVTSVPKSMNKPDKTENPAILFDGDHLDAYQDLPEWLQKKIDSQIKDTPQFDSGNDDGWRSDLDDDVPF